MKLDSYLSRSERQVERSEREREIAVHEGVNSTEIQHLDNIMQDCQGDLHVLCWRTMQLQNNFGKKKMWEELLQKALGVE